MLKARVVSDTSRFGVVGVPVELGTSQAVGITVDNYSNQWLTVGTDGMFVPPFTIGWAADFYGSSASSIQVRLGAPAGASQSVVIINGAVVIAIYDNFVAPNPGVSSLNLSDQTTYQADGTANTPDFNIKAYRAGQNLPVGIVLPSYFVNGQVNESFDYIEQRGTTFVKSGKTAVLAGVLTNLTTPPNAVHQRLFSATISLSVATDVLFDYSVWGNGLGSANLAAGVPVMFYYGPNGMNVNGSAASNYQAQCTLACTVYWTIVLGSI